MEQKASEDGKGKIRLQSHSNGKIGILYLVSYKRLQTANKTVLGVSLIYMVRAHTTL